MTPAEDDFQRLEQNRQQAAEHLGEPPRLKSLAEVIAPVEAAYRDKWARQDAAKAERESTPRGRRIEAAREFLQTKLPKMLQVQSNVLRARCSDEVLEVVDAWQWDAGSLLLCGPTRIGKSTACGVLVRRLLSAGIRAGTDEAGTKLWERARRIEWAHASDLANARKRHPLGENEAPVIESACRASLLILDDLGWDIEPAPICDVLNKRYERGAPTIVTTGLEAARIFERYSEAVARRIFDAGDTKGKIFEFFGKKKPKEHPGQRSLEEKWKQTPDRTTVDPNDDGRYGPKR